MLPQVDTGLTSAASGGHLDIVLLMLELGATNYNHSMIAAAHRGHIEIVRQMLAQGADDYNSAMTEAASQGHQNIVELIRERMNPA